jgi:hypothetical protein
MSVELSPPYIDSPQPDFIFRTEQRNKVNAGGLAMRLEAESPMFCSWNVNARLGTSLLYTKIDSTDEYTNEPSTKKATAETEGTCKAIGSFDVALRLTKNFQC